MTLAKAVVLLATAAALGSVLGYIVDRSEPIQFACPAEREFYTTCAEFQEIEKCRRNFSHLQLCR